MRKKSAIAALFPGVRRGVLELTFGEPDRWWYLSEMAQRLGTAPSSLQREVESLASAGLLRTRRDGRRTYFQAEREAAIFSELRAIVRKTMGVPQAVHRALEPIEKRIGLAFVFGSSASRTDRATSDVDLMVVSDDLTLEEIHRRLAPVEKRIGRRVNPTLYTREQFVRRRRDRNPFLEKVLARERITLIGNEHEIGAR